MNLTPRTPASVPSRRRSGAIVLMMGGVDVAIWGSGGEFLLHSTWSLKDKKYMGGILNVLGFNTVYFLIWNFS